MLLLNSSLRIHPRRDIAWWGSFMAKCNSYCVNCFRYIYI